MALREGATPALPILGILALGLGAVFVGPLVMWLLGPPEEPFRWPFRYRRRWWDDWMGGSADAAPDLGRDSDGDRV